MTYHRAARAPAPVVTRSLLVTFPRTRTWVEAVIADTEPARIRGLHGRTALRPNEGMLFHFPDQRTPVAMTMEKMLIPLDIVFIDEDMTIRHIAPQVQPGRRDPVASAIAVPWVLEVPAGFAARRRLLLGDKAELVVP